MTCENSNINGGLYSVVSEVLGSNYPTFVVPVGVEDEFGQVGTYSDLLKAYKLTPNDIVEKVIGYRSEVQGFDEDVVNKVLWEK